MEFKRRKLRTQHYLYVERETPMEGPKIAEAMGSAFAEVFRFLGEHGITPKSKPLSVYTEMPSGMLKFRAGAAVSKADAAKAEGTVKADTLPKGEAMTVTHVGPYASLNQTHGALWTHMEEKGIAAGLPVWEIYTDDPGDTAEAELRTEIFRAIGR